MKKWIPWSVLALVVIVLAYCSLPKPEGPFHTRAFGQLPVLLNGRFQPFDSVARNSLLQIRTKQTVPAEANGRTETLSAMDWLLEVMMKPEAADDRKVFRIDNNEVSELLKVPDGQKYYSFNQLRPQADEIEKQAARIDPIDASKRTVFESQLMKLYEMMNLYQRLEVSLKPPGSDDFAAELDAYQKSILPGVAAVNARAAGQKFDQDAFNNLLSFMGGYQTVASFALPLTIPPADASLPRDDWQNIGTNLMQTAHTGEFNPATKFYAAMVTAYRSDQPDEFNHAVGEYRAWLADRFAPQARKTSQEYFFNTLQPFYNATVIYVLALVLACIYLLVASEWIRKSAFYLVVLAVVIHTFGLVFRMYLEGRPPVTNLYSSAIFIGWACVLLGLVLEKIYPIGIGILVASFVGFVTQIIALHLALSGDTMEMMRAVLDTNLWLATHVVTVTLGYASTFLAGFLAIVYILLGLFTKRLTQPLDPKAAVGLTAITAMAAPVMAAPAIGLAVGKGLSSEIGKMEIGKVMAKMVYGIVCFATLFSFVGTVLGGIWADQSWGRFWGWDPKENGALLIVLWNATILHARWGGLVRERGLMNLAVVGNIVTSWSWFGVNMLGIGLHSYGFTDAAFWWLRLFIGSQIVLILLGLLPKIMWRSFQPARPAAAA
ncbi:MAG TPA: cytochrome c biogenesis protein CcsA [Verrucomicrobiae bacterium]|nr:cytochrome c biogenesis protein CcsA [Verrucomicrobiae bacterium]